MQAPLSTIDAGLAQIELTMSKARIARYIKASGGNISGALALYRWNCELSQSLYWPLQTLEIACRNGIASVLSAKYGSDWHFDAKFAAALDPEARKKLTDSITRQQRSRKTARPAVDSVIADITFGFWTSLVTKRYEVPFGWATRLATAFPHLPDTHGRNDVATRMDAARGLRNRISHHEPIYHLQLDAKYADTMDVIGWVCPETRRYVEQHCTYKEVSARKP